MIALLATDASVSALGIFFESLGLSGCDFF